MLTIDEYRSSGRVPAWRVASFAISLPDPTRTKNFQNVEFRKAAGTSTTAMTRGGLIRWRFCPWASFRYIFSVRFGAGEAAVARCSASAVNRSSARSPELQLAASYVGAQREDFVLAENSAGKQRGAPFRKGQSGNPSGKPPGARNKITMLAEKLMQDDARDIVRVVLEAAKGGDMTAARLVLERIAPVRKGRPVYFDLPPVNTAGDIAAAMAALTTAMASGDLTPDEAATVASVLEIRRKTLETEELSLRLQALEEAVQK